MGKKSYLLGILVIVLVFGMVVTAYGIGTDKTPEEFNRRVEEGRAARVDVGRLGNFAAWYTRY